MSPLSDLPDNSNPAMPEVPSVVHFARDEDGLVKGLAYKYTPEGRVDYKAMLQTGDLYVKKEFRDEVVKEYGKALSELDLTTVKDRYLFITLAGINRLANLRGMRALTYPQISVSPDKAVAVCEIEFIGNYETDGYPFVCSSMASATPRSMDANFVPFLETFAENRAFARCVKRALQINILSDVEVGGESKKKIVGQEEGETNGGGGEPTGFQPYHKLIEVCATQKPAITFAHLQAAAVRHNSALAADHKERIHGEPEQWTDFSSIPPLAAYLLINMIQERAAQNAAAAKKGK